MYRSDSNCNVNGTGDNLVFKSKVVCSSASHKNLLNSSSNKPVYASGEPTVVCVELGCQKRAICARCASVDHANHRTEPIESIRERAVKCINAFGKSDSDTEIAIVERLQEKIQSEFLQIQVTLAKALKNFSERCLLYKESIKRAKLDAIYKIEVSCEAIRRGQLVQLAAFNEQYKSLCEQAKTRNPVINPVVCNEIEINEKCDNSDGNGSAAADACSSSSSLSAKPATDSQRTSLRRVNILQSDLESIFGKLNGISGNIAQLLKSHTVTVNQAFAKAVANDELADPKLKALDISNNQIVIEPSVSSAINDISFDFLDQQDDDDDDNQDEDQERKGKDADNQEDIEQIIVGVNTDLHSGQQDHLNTSAQLI